MALEVHDVDGHLVYGGRIGVLASRVGGLLFVRLEGAVPRINQNTYRNLRFRRIGS